MEDAGRLRRDFGFVVDLRGDFGRVIYFWVSFFSKIGRENRF